MVRYRLFRLYGMLFVAARCNGVRKDDKVYVRDRKRVARSQ